MGVGGGGGKAGVAHLQGLGAANWDGRPCPGGGGAGGAGGDAAEWQQRRRRCGPGVEEARASSGALGYLRLRSCMLMCKRLLRLRCQPEDPSGAIPCLQAAGVEHAMEVAHTVLDTFDRQGERC